MATEPDLCRAAAGWNRARRAAAAALAAAFAVLLPVAVTSAWIRGTVLSTSGYVAAVTPVAANPAVRDTVQEVITTQVLAALKHAETSLPPAAGVLAGPLSTGLADLAGNRISEFMASSAFQRLWAEVNRFAHSQLISVLNGDSTLVQATGGQVVLNLVPLVNDVLHRDRLPKQRSGHCPLTGRCSAAKCDMAGPAQPPCHIWVWRLVLAGDVATASARGIPAPKGDPWPAYQPTPSRTPRRR